MGALYGYIQAGGFDRKLIREKMTNPAMYWGSDGHYTYNGDQVILGLLHRYNTPEAVYESQPYTTGAGHIVFFNGRIDNRNELSDRTGIPDRVDIPDGRFAAVCWEKFGEDLVDRIIGDWVIIAWNPFDRKLNILRDHHGYSALYYYSNGKFFAFGTSIKSLLALEQIPKEPNMLRVAQVLTSWHGKGVECGYKNIFRLPPAHIMEVNNKLEIKTTRYWFPENTKPLIYKNEEDYYRHFLEEYTRAVRVRLRSYKPVGAQLSGGLDSGSIVALAAGLLKEKGIRLPAFTSVPAFPVEGLTSKNRFGDEGRLARMTADYTGNTDWYPVDARDADPFKAVSRGVGIHDEPYHAAANAYWIQEIYKNAQMMVLGTLLTGQGGNATVSWPTPGFLELMSKKREQILFSHLFSWYGWRRKIIPVYTPQNIRNMIQKRKMGKVPFLDYSAIRSDYAISNRILEQMQEEGHDPFFFVKSNIQQTRLNIIRPGCSVIGFLYSQSSAFYNIEIRDPSIDRRIIEFCLAMPNHIYVNNGKDRLLIRKSFMNLMPSDVLWNNQRGTQASDIGYKIIEYVKAGKEIIDYLLESPLCIEILDINRMKIILNELSQDMNYKRLKMVGPILIRGIAVGLFIKRFS